MTRRCKIQTAMWLVIVCSVIAQIVVMVAYKATEPLDVMGLLITVLLAVVNTPDFQ